MILAIGKRQNNFRCRRAFTLVELILVLALLIVITSIVAPAMQNFIRGRALDSESRRMVALIDAGQSRAVSEGMPMVLWIDAKSGEYGLTEETPEKNGDANAEELTLDSTLQISVANFGTKATTMFRNLPAIKFLPDGTIDENSPQTLQLTDSAGFSRWLVETRERTGYEIRDSNK